MSINIHFVLDGVKKSTRQLKSDFKYIDFVDLVNNEYGSNAHKQYTFATKGKGLNLDSEADFNPNRGLITNGVNIYVGRRMHGGAARHSFSVWNQSTTI